MSIKEEFIKTLQRHARWLEKQAGTLSHDDAQAIFAEVDNLWYWSNHAVEYAPDYPDTDMEEQE